MKQILKKLTYIFIVFVLIFISSSIINTSNTSKASFDESYQGYLQTYEAYRSAHSHYITTRGQYLQYQTLNAQKEALDAVKDFLLWRDRVILAYISLLREKNSDDTYSGLLDAEEQFLNNHIDTIPAVSTLDDAENIAGEVEERHLVFQTTAKKIVLNIILNKVEAIRQRYQLQTIEASSLVNEIKSQGKDVTTLERWLLDAKSKELFAEQKILSARLEISNLSSRSLESLNSEYNKVQFTIFEANQYLREALDYLTELSETIKYGQY